MDEFDALVSTAGNSDQERRVSACLKSLFDDQLSDNDVQKTVVIGKGNKNSFSNHQIALMSIF